MDAASKGHARAADFAEPSDKVLKGDLVAVPDVGGMSVDEATQAARGRRLQRPTSPARRPTATARSGTVAYTDPGRLGPARLDDRPVHLHRLRPGRRRQPETTPQAEADADPEGDRRPRPTPTRSQRRRPTPLTPADGHGRAEGRLEPGPREARPAVRARHRRGLTARGSASFTAAATRPPSARPATSGLGGLHDQAHLRHPGRAGLLDRLRPRGPRARRRTSCAAGRPRARRARPPPWRPARGGRRRCRRSTASLRFLASLATTLSTSSSLSSRASVPATSSLVTEVSAIRSVPERTWSRCTHRVGEVALEGGLERGGHGVGHGGQSSAGGWRSAGPHVCEDGRR